MSSGSPARAAAHPEAAALGWHGGTGISMPAERGPTEPGRGRLSPSGGGDGHGGGGGRSRMFKGLRMTEEGWLHFQRVEQHEHDAREDDEEEHD